MAATISLRTYESRDPSEHDIALSVHLGAQGCPKYRIKRHSKKNVLRDGVAPDPRPLFPGASQDLRRSTSSQSACLSDHLLPIQSVGAARHCVLDNSVACHQDTHSLSTSDRPASTVSRGMDHNSSPLSSSTSPPCSLVQTIWDITCEALDDIGDELMPELIPADSTVTSASNSTPMT